MSTETEEGSKVETTGDVEGPAIDRMRREMEEQFNMQRARMKELFLQKEEEMQRLTADKQQLWSEVVSLRAELEQLRVLSDNQRSEIQSLQLLVSETVEASSSDSEESRRLRQRCAELEHGLQQCRLQMQQQEVSLAPATLVRSLARKLGADQDDQANSRKVALVEEELQSLIQPLEQEVSALKAKLRDTDTQLQHALKSKSPAAPSAGDSKESSEVRQCDMCANYEKQLVAEQALAEAAREKSAKVEQALKLATEELEGVRSLHDETVRTWHGERAAAQAQLTELRAAVSAAERCVAARAGEAQASARRALEHVTTLTVDRETLQRRLDILEHDNAVLMGQYTKKAAEMQNEVIDLPNSVEALQEQVLHLREQLIQCAVGRERAAGDGAALRGSLLRLGQRAAEGDAALGDARAALRHAREELDRLKTENEQMQALGDKLRQSNDMAERLLDDKSRLQTEVSSLRQRVSILQQELDNSEKVQQDFVRLSQSLQVQLQRIREADTEVRWQHEEDVTECPQCKQALPNNKKKVHCRHCGRIFCGGCASHAVPSGPRGAPARVCAVCRTLLQPDCKPYFSTHAPHSPD